VNFPGGWELVLVLLVVLLVFGSKRLPDSARALGRSLRIFKAETKGLRGDDEPAPRFDPHTGKPLEPPTGSDSAN
jgi:sec-independent protein translocase protein TatA